MRPQSCPTLCNAMDCNSPGSSVHGIILAKILEWVTISSPEYLPNPGNKPESPAAPALAGRFLPLSHLGANSHTSSSSLWWIPRSGITLPKGLKVYVALNIHCQVTYWFIMPPAMFKPEKSLISPVRQDFSASFYIGWFLNVEPKSPYQWLHPSLCFLWE